ESLRKDEGIFPRFFASVIRFLAYVIIALSPTKLLDRSRTSQILRTNASVCRNKSTIIRASTPRP
ncbi:MAG: hypothetical protein LBQ43_02695, partial [Holosporales bacterium]|nr:hypothetical protein [Holosporales bacterium]